MAQGFGKFTWTPFFNVGALNHHIRIDNALMLGNLLDYVFAETCIRRKGALGLRRNRFVEVIFVTMPFFLICSICSRL